MKRLKETIGFIGCGNMGSAILEGLIRNKIVKPSQVFVYDPATALLKKVRSQFKVHMCSSNKEVVHHSQIVILAIKPQELRKVSTELRPMLRKHVVVSILAGTPIQKVRSLLGRGVFIVRAMPNLGAKVGESITALSGDSKAVQKGEVIFSGCGATIRLAEKYFDLVTAVSGSGPAYFFYLMELLVKFARASGLSLGQANRLVVQTALGTGKLAKLAKESPEILRKRVTSKGGTTEAALSVLFAEGVARIFHRALTKAILKAKKLSKS